MSKDENTHETFSIGTFFFKNYFYIYFLVMHIGAILEFNRQLNPALKHVENILDKKI